MTNRRELFYFKKNCLCSYTAELSILLLCVCGCEYFSLFSFSRSVMFWFGILVYHFLFSLLPLCKLPSSKLPSSSLTSPV